MTQGPSETADAASEQPKSEPSESALDAEPSIDGVQEDDDHLEFNPLADLDDLASNDEWAFEQADRMVKSLPQKEGKDRRTEGEVFDQPTLMTLHKLLVNGALKSLDYPISTGKEANVFRGTTVTGGYVAVKIYRVNTATFKHVLQYIQGDERFQGVAKDKRGLTYAWAQKEFRNLHRLRDAGIDVPEPIRVLNNVLITEYLGIEEGAWPQLKDLGRLEKKEAEKFWKKITQDYEDAYKKAGLVHGDLSEYNILVEHAGTKDANPRIIDVGQAVLRTHPMAWEFLARDAKNLAGFFKRQRLRTTAEDITNRLRP